MKDCGLWPAEPKVRPAAWLQNFEDDERPVAAVLLDHFVFFGGAAVDRMLLSGFRSLHDRVNQRRGRTAASNLLAAAVFTAIEGERPNLTDSGHLFCRKLRQIVGLPDARFANPEEAIEAAAQGTPVVFLDDFIGSGDQFMSTWERQYRHVQPRSFADAYATKAFDAYYLSLVATETGRDRVAQDAPMVWLQVNHVVGPVYGIASTPRTPFLPDIEDITQRIEQLLAKYESRLIVPHYLGTPESRKYGFERLGLQIAFDHSTPDATLPIFWAEAGANWTPLVRRT
jgi:hypothetical protein